MNLFPFAKPACFPLYFKNFIVTEVCLYTLNSLSKPFAFLHVHKDIQEIPGTMYADR